jgi:hypothetical protein
VGVGEAGMSDTFDKPCGYFSLYVSPPSPRWVTIRWEGEELIPKGMNRAHIKIEDLHDLKYLIERAIAEVGRR